MASTYTSRINLELQADGENPNSWGDILNNNVIQLVDDAVAAYTSVTLSSTDYTLTTNDGATDQARSAMLEIVGTVSSDSNLIIPGVSKFYIVKDRSVRQNDAAIKVKTAAGSGFTVAASATRVVICDSVSVYGVDALGATVCLTDLFGATGNFSACVSTTNLVAATGSFTTKVSGVAAEFSGNVCAAEYYGGGGNLTGITTTWTSIASDVTPDGDGTRNLGASVTEWNHVFMRYPTLWERQLNIITLFIQNDNGTMELSVSGHASDPASGGTDLNPAINDNVSGDFAPELLDSSQGFNSKPAGLLAADKAVIVFNTDDQTNQDNIIGSCNLQKASLDSTYIEGVAAQWRVIQRNIGGSNIYRPEVNLWYNGGNSLLVDTTHFSTSKFLMWQIQMYAK